MLAGQLLIEVPNKLCVLLDPSVADFVRFAEGFIFFRHAEHVVPFFGRVLDALPSLAGEGQDLLAPHICDQTVEVLPEVARQLVA